MRHHFRKIFYIETPCYIGQTPQYTKKRIASHQQNLRNTKQINAELSRHSRHNHSIDFETPNCENNTYIK